MPDPFTLTCLDRIGGPILANVGGCLVAPIQRQFNYMCCFNSNITELETQFEELETTRQGVQMGVDESRRNVRVIGPNVEAWLKRANEVTSEVDGIIQDKPKVKEGCLNGWCPNLKLRYSLSKKAVKKTKVVIELKVAGVQYTRSSYSPPPPVPIPNRDFMGFESRRLNMEEIIKDLKHDEINLIGVCGMGGVGKTTLVNEVARRAKEYNLFDEVAMAVVGQKPDLTNVQACIADMLGLKNLLDMKSPDVRANLLRTRLLQDNKKVLVILDDIWAEFDLKAMGIPLEGADKNFKMLYTSRTRNLWNDLRTKNEIPLEILSKDEAWHLFREKAGDSADVPDLQPIAKQIVNECGCLPLALVLIGSALSKKSGRNYTKEIWKAMLDRLTCPRSTPADERLSSCLELSYEYLEDKEAKRLFLLCCLFKEDEDIRIEDLARYGLGLSLFDEIPEMEKVRSQVFLIVDDLKSRYLLLDSKEEEEECVKVHDVVRDMGISIASKDKFALVSHGAISQWPKTATHEQYAISVISDEIEELPEGLTYPNLEFLTLRCQELEKLPPNFFEGMGKLKVLELPWFRGILTLRSLRNLTTLSLEGFCGTLDDVSLSLIGGILNLEILNFRYSKIEELPVEIGELVKLRLLDLRDTRFLTRIRPHLISSLVHLEELYFWGSNFIYWEGEQKEVRNSRLSRRMASVFDLNTLEERNAKLSEFEFLSNLNTLEISIRSKSDAPIPKVPIFSKLNIFRVVIAYNVREVFIHDRDFLNEKCERVLWVEAGIPIPLDGGGIDSLLRSSDWLHLEGRGCNDLVRDGVDGLQQIKVAQLLYTNSGDGVLALGSDGTMTPWMWGFSEHNPSGKATASVFPHQWQPASGLAMTNNVTGVNLEEAVPCMALSKNDSYLISACGGDVSVFNTMTFKVLKMLLPPPPASTFLALHPQEKTKIIAIGMEDSTICIYDVGKGVEVKSELKGHNKHITGLVFSTNLNILVSSGADAQLCVWSIDTWEKLKSIPIQLPAGKACNSDTRVQFHSDQIRLLVSHETQLAIYDASEMDRIRQWVPQDVLLAPISFAAYSCDSQLVYTSFCDGNIGVFDADSLTLTCRIAPSAYSPALSSGGQAVYPRVVAAHPQKPNQFAIGLTNGFVIVMEPKESEGKWGLSPTVDDGMLNGRTASSSSKTSSHTPYQNQDGRMARSMEKPRTLDDVTDKSKPWKVAETQCQLVGMPNSIDEAHKVAQLLFTNSGNGVLALGSNGTMTLWNRGFSQHSPSGKATTSGFPHQWQPASGLAMTDDVTSVNLEEAVPCMALSKNDSYIISACGGEVLLFNRMTSRVVKMLLPPPPASTFLAFYPQDNNIIAIGMEDSTICIYDAKWDEVRSELKGHKKRITGLAFSTNLNILVSSGADAQLCIWRLLFWEHLKSVPIQLPAGKACNGDTRVQFHSDQIHLLVSHETQLAIYDASEMDRICQWVPQDVLPAPISFAAYSCDSQLVYTSFCDGNIGVFDADSLTLTCRIAPSAYSSALSSGSQAVYPLVVATHPQKPSQFAIGLTNGSVIVMEPKESKGKWGLSPTVDNGMPNDQKRGKEIDLNLDDDEEVFS